MNKPFHNITNTNAILKAILFCISFTIVFIAFSFLKSFVPHTSERLVYGLIGTTVAFLVTFVFLKFDKKSFTDIRLRFDYFTIPKFVAGIGAGIILMGILALGVLYFKNASFQVNSKSSVLHFLIATMPLIPLAFMEEIAFRAYPLEIIKEKTGVRLPIFITSILFALYHVANGWSIASSFYGPAVWGLLFGLAAVYSKGIAFPTGIHYAANLTTSAFGEPDNTVSVWIIKLPENTGTQPGFEWLTIIPSFVLLVFAVLCIELYVRRNNTL